ncbi:carboxy terminal-processing peptidase [soil metagenome]
MRASAPRARYSDQVRRLTIGLSLTLFLAACSAKAPASADTKHDAVAPKAVVVASAGGKEAASSPGVAAPDPREQALARTALELFEQGHLLHEKIDDSISRDAFTTYMDRLDAGKMFLLKADRDALAKYADKIDDELRSGSLDLGHSGNKIFLDRVTVVDKMVADLLSRPFDLENEESFETDPDKMKPAATEAELKDRWRQRLELEVLERTAAMEERLNPPKAKTPPKTKKEKAEKDPTPVDPTLAKIPTTPEGREAKAREDLAKAYAARFARLKVPAPLDAAADVINAVANTLDPHTLYLPPAEKANFEIQMSGSLEGIGASLRERDHGIEIIELIPGGAAARQGGLGPGDIILTVSSGGKDPVDVFDMRIDDVVKMIRGPKNSVVTLRVRKPAGTEEVVSITRDKIVIEDAYARGAVLTRKGLPPFGYIHLPSFYGGSAGGQRTSSEDVNKLLSELAAKKVRGVVLDLRSNGGGILRDAIDLTGHLIDHGPVVQVQDSRNRKEVLSDDDRGIAFDGQVIVLVDHFSASASEIVAGALQDYHRALIVGTGPTHGKGTVQTLADLDQVGGTQLDLGVLKLTIQQFFRVSGSSTQREGVVPDIVLPDPAGHIEAGESSLPHALPHSSIASAKHDDWKGSTWDTPALVVKSSGRVAKHPLLSKVATATAFLKSRKNDTLVPLARKAWEKRRTDLRTALDAASPDLDKALPAFAVVGLDEAKPDERAIKWRENLAKDPWVEECLNILADMPK